MQLDISPLVNDAIAFAAIALPVIATAIGGFVYSHCAFLRKIASAQQIADAAKRGAGIAFQIIKANQGSVDTVYLHNTALEAGASYVARSYPDKIKMLGGVSDEHLKNMVRGELGGLQAQDAKPGPIVAPIPAPPVAPPPPLAT